jgi:lysozyme
MLSDRGLDLIKSFEGLSLKAYPDPGTGGEPWTIGYGHTGDVQQGDTCTEPEATEFLRGDCGKAERCIDDNVTAELTQNQYDALGSFIYNCGCGNFKSSTLLKLVNASDMDGAAQQFIKWNKAAGRVMAGLTRRRAAEAELFSEGS